MADPVNPGTPGQDLDSGLQLQRILRAAGASRFLLVLLGAAGLILGAGVATMIPDLYESKTKVLLRERKLIDDSTLLKAIEAKPLAQKEQTLEEELKSYAWIHDVLQKVEWLEYARIRHSPAKIGELIDKIRDDKHYEVSMAMDSSGELLVTLSFRWYDPKQACDFVLAARRNWIDRRDEDHRQYWNKQLAIADQVLNKYRVDYQRAREDLDEFDALHDVSFLAGTNNPDAEVRLSLVQQSNDLKSEISAKETQVAKIEEQLGQTPETIAGETTSQPNPHFDAARLALTRAQTDLEAELKRKTAVHPDVLERREALVAAQAAFDLVKDEPTVATASTTLPNPSYLDLRKGLDSLVPELSGLRDRYREVERQLFEIEERLKQQPVTRSARSVLERNLGVAEEALSLKEGEIKPLRDQVENIDRRTQVSLGNSEQSLLEAGAYDVLEDPVIAERPTGLPKPLFALIGLLVGMAAGLAVALVRELARNTYTTPNEVQSSLRLPVLGVVGRIATLDEVRSERFRSVTQALGSVLIVLTLAGLVYLVTEHPERLPPSVQGAIEALRANFR